MRGWNFIPALLALFALSGQVSASLGDHLPEFRECVADCIATNCETNRLSIPLHHRLLLWTCPSECDYTCQHIITDKRLARDPPYLQPVLQFHGKWPFYRFLGMQEPASVLFSFLNLLGHQWGLRQLRARLPPRYPMRKYYLWLGRLGCASWIFSMIFHTRDFNLTEKLDYFAAGASVLYGLYYGVIRVFRLEGEVGEEKRRARGTEGRDVNRRATLRRAWTAVCAAAYISHVSYLSFVRFDYTYNMAANVVVGVLQNLLWSGFAIYRYRQTGQVWTLWPLGVVWFISAAMGLELFDFPPFGGMVDAHSLWHLGTVAPVFWWYNFLIKDAQEDVQMGRLKA